MQFILYLPAFILYEPVVYLHFSCSIVVGISVGCSSVGCSSNAEDKMRTIDIMRIVGVMYNRNVELKLIQKPGRAIERKERWRARRVVEL